MSDPLTFGARFKSAAERIREAGEIRDEAARNVLPFNVTFLDDVFRGILPHDLVLIGAGTGAGKTHLASIIAETNVVAGKRVHFFALEAEPNEIENRIHYRMISKFAWEKRIRGCEDLNYPDWYLHRCDSIISEEVEEAARRRIEKAFPNLFTYYRDQEFTMHDISRLFLSIQDQTDLIILDHIHYVDDEDGVSENRSLKRIAKTVRDVSLSMGKPVILIAHLRKKEARTVLIPSLDDFHGSSDLTKIVTKCVLLSRAVDWPSEDSHVVNTYVYDPKHRMAGSSGLCAVAGFDLGTQRYEKEYLLGRMSLAGDKFIPLGEEELPRWAKHAKRGQALEEVL